MAAAVGAKAEAAELRSQLMSCDEQGGRSGEGGGDGASLFTELKRLDPSLEEQLYTVGGFWDVGHLKGDLEIMRARARATSVELRVNRKAGMSNTATLSSDWMVGAADTAARMYAARICVGEHTQAHKSPFGCGQTKEDEAQPPLSPASLQAAQQATQAAKAAHAAHAAQAAKAAQAAEAVKAAQAAQAVLHAAEEVSPSNHSKFLKPTTPSSSSIL